MILSQKQQGEIKALASLNRLTTDHQICDMCACVLIKHLLWVYRQTESLVVKKLEEYKAKPTS